ncbi:hypothetical protein ACSXEK_16335 (plasmid) [Clostridium perfringens]|uniref:hypothetical protein n=1 Tax=Clostridium perfringens TaxID=1502 RepID=UPI00338D4AA1|nr:hypothetical protein [Clostridium perfringens]
MALSRLEQEVHISKTANEKEFSLYVTDPKFVRKMKRIGVDPYKKEKIDDDTYGYFYKLDEKQISFRKKRVLSEEQKKTLSDRMKSIKNNK